MFCNRTTSLVLGGLLAATLGLAASSSSALAAAPAAAPVPRPVAVSRAYLGARNLPAAGVAIQGYSPVSYFDGKAERGDALFAVEHEGVTYHLTSAAQVARFRAEPARYVPMFGGWCAFGMAIEDKFPVNPERFKIVGGKLHLFLENAGIDALQLWNDGDEAALSARAAAHWKKVQG